MKKIAMFIAAAAIAVSASAQKTVITASKATDNIYIGVNAGAMTSVKSQYGLDNAFKMYQPQFGVRIGKNLTTVFGLAIEGDLTFDAHSAECDYSPLCTKTFIQALDVDLLGTANFMNMFAGYKGEPRTFEIIGVGGFGWTHQFGLHKANALNSKVGIDFAINFGKSKEWQVYVEPSLTYYLQSFKYGALGAKNGDGFKYNANNAEFSLKAGLNYKFPCSNGKHNFTKEQLRDQAEVDGLNNQINSLRGDLGKAKDASAAAANKVKDLKKQLTDCQNKPVPVVKKKAANLQPSVVFAQGKSNVEKSQMANIDMIAKYMKNNPDAKVKISGYASPEGSKELNQKLSEARAKNVKDVLVKKYKISADRLEAEGLGATDKLFDEVEFNRVALFNDTTK